MSDTIWKRSSVVRAPEEGEVSVWRVRLNAADVSVGHLKSMLSMDELERAERFHFQTHHDSYVITRATLRQILGACLQMDPRDVQFGYGPQRKPYLGNWSGAAHERLHFNVSHSSGLALIAVTRGREVGVDVERIHAVRDLESLASQFFSRFEFQQLMSLPYERRLASFCACWTRKEAYLKATGRGLSYPMRRVEVTLAPGDQPRIVAVDGSAAFFQRRAERIES